MISAIIVDDEKNNISHLKKMIQAAPYDIDIIDTAESVDDALLIIQQKKPDLVFLDIQMPVKNGFDLLRQFNPIPFKVIIVTSYDNYAIQAIKFSAVDYILKPINREDLYAALAKLEDKNHPIDDPNPADNLISNLEKIKKNDIERIAIKLNNIIKYIEIKDIIFIEADSGYSIIHLPQEKYIEKKAVIEFEELLNQYRFFRIHHKYLVNSNFIKEFKFTERPEIILKNNTRLEVSLRRKQELKSFLNLM
jgi:two-component system, LytTR family, response regulator